MTTNVPAGLDAAPHDFVRRGWRFWICRHCFAPRSLHPRIGWVRSRPLGDNCYLSATAPHFKEGW
jgi:hypothetical protein